MAPSSSGIPLTTFLFLHPLPSLITEADVLKAREAWKHALNVKILGQKFWFPIF